MNSRTWIAVLLCCLVWSVYMSYFAPPPPAKVPPAGQTAADGTAPTSPGNATPGNAAPGSTGAPGATASPSPTAGLILPSGYLPTTSTTLKHGELTVGFSKTGGKISSIETGTHKLSMEKDAPEMPILVPETAPWEMATVFTEPKLSELSTGSYEAASKGNGIAFSKKVPGGLSIYKEYAWGDSHLIEWKLKIENLDASRQDWGYLYVPVGRLHSEYTADSPLKAWEVVSYQNDSVSRKNLDALEPAVWTTGQTGWLAFGNRYFATALMPSGEINPDVGFVKDASWTGGLLRYPLVFKAGQKELDLSIRVFAGPKDYPLLKREKGLTSLIDYGMFSFLAFPLLELLKFFFRFVGNYGIAIILLTVLVRLLFYPLSLKGYRSMKAMQKLQPQIQALKEKYKDDAQKFGQEQMNLFRTHKVNPAGGCLPMLVQLPVFIALYAVLNSSVELFHAPFFGWIKDLSARDPYYIFPALMGISMFVQQKMTPAVGMDPTQQKIMLIMPVIFSFIMLNLPSGLTIYIFLSTLLGILQQVMMNRESKDDKGLVTVKG